MSLFAVKKEKRLLAFKVPGYIFGLCQCWGVLNTRGKYPSGRIRKSAMKERRRRSVTLLLLTTTCKDAKKFQDEEIVSLGDVGMK